MAKGDVLVRMKADVGNYNANLAAANRTLKNFREENLSLGGVVKNMTRSFTGYAAGLMSIGAVAGKLHETVTEAVQLAKSAEGIRLAFNRLNDPGILDGLRQATHGTVTDVELMKSAVKFNDFKLPLDELGTMLAFAQQKAKDTGQSVDYMVDSIVTGLGRQSLMILDNLGLSASDIKERMKQTGDMTKAVGEIIREQMAKAGDYVETASDRAAQANVSLQNKMEELGRKFAPLEEASSSLWTSMKLGILDVIGGPLTSLLGGLTEAGRMMNAYGKMGGSGKVGGMIANLAGASAGKRQSLYQRQQEQFWRYINPREQQIKDIRAWQSGQRGEALQGRIGAITEKYGSLDVTKIQAEVDAAKKMLSDYQQSAKQILSPIKPVIDTKQAEQNITSLTNKQKDIKKQHEIVKGSIADLNNQIKELRDAQANVTNTTEWQNFQAQIDAVSIRIKQLKGELPAQAEGVSIRDTVAVPTASDMIKRGDQRIKNLKVEDKPTKQENNSLEKTQDIVGGLSSIASGLKQMGIELPDGVQKVLDGMQGLMSIIQGVQTILNIFTTTTSSAQTASLAANTSTLAANTAALATLTGAIATNTATSLIPFANGGVVKAAGGYRVPGRTFSGDMIPARLNAGETVLNQAQAGVIANALQDREFGGGSGMMQPYVEGEKIFLGMNNTSKRMGRGEIVTTSTLRHLGLI